MYDNNNLEKQPFNKSTENQQTTIASLRNTLNINGTQSISRIDKSNITKTSMEVPVEKAYPLLFQSAEEEEFPSSNGNVSRIPHIIHQMYADDMIPEMYINHVRSFIQNNPTWEYRFWTDESGRQLLQKHHPYLVDVYDNFGSNVKRSDLLRYAVLYEYGGFYADLDMDNLRSLNISTMKYACIVPVEPFEHSVLLNGMPFLMNNAIMSCRPKHPFFKLLLSKLRYAHPSGYPVGTTGPGFVTRIFYEYNNMNHFPSLRNKTEWSSNSPYFYKGELKETDNNAVYVPNSQYFMDNLDPVHVTENGKFTQLCKQTQNLSGMYIRACSEFHRRKKVRENKKYTFTVHHWYHLWEMSKSSVSNLKKVNISSIVPKVIRYTQS
jgi:hypothetical protein